MEGGKQTKMFARPQHTLCGDSDVRDHPAQGAQSIQNSPESQIHSGSGAEDILGSRARAIARAPTRSALLRCFLALAARVRGRSSLLGRSTLPSVLYFSLKLTRDQARRVQALCHGIPWRIGFSEPHGIHASGSTRLETQYA